MEKNKEMKNRKRKSVLHQISRFTMKIIPIIKLHLALALFFILVTAVLADDIIVQGGTVNISRNLNVSGDLTFASFTTCNLDTDANGNILCGSDDAGSTSGDVTQNITTLNLTIVEIKETNLSNIYSNLLSINTTILNNFSDVYSNILSINTTILTKADGSSTANLTTLNLTVLEILNTNLSDIYSNILSINSSAGGDHMNASGGNFSGPINILSGNVGIGTTSPAAALHINGSSGVVAVVDAASSTTQLRIRNSGFADFYDFVARDGRIDFEVNDGAKLTIEDGGNVGIGTTSPGSLLTVSGGDLNVTDGNDDFFVDVSAGSVGVGIGKPVTELHIHETGITGADQVGITMTTTKTGLVGGNGVLLFIDTGNHFTINNYEDADIEFAPNNTLEMVIKSGGNVGIGTSTPSQKLHVNGDVNISSDFLYVGSASANLRLDRAVGSNEATVNFRNLSTLMWKVGIENIPASVSNDLVFSTANNQDPPKLIIKRDSGNVGIGTSSPDQVLQVVSAISIGTNDVTQGILHVYGDDVAEGGQINLYLPADQDDTDNVWSIDVPSRDSLRIFSGDASSIIEFSRTDYIFNEIGNDIDFRIESDTDQNAFRLIGSNGNLGLGDASPDAAIDIVRNGADAIIRIEQNGTGTTSGIGFIRARLSGIGQQAACLFVDSDNSTNQANFTMDVDSSVGCGAAFGAQQRFQISSNGDAFFGNLNVGIGTQSPTHTLHVVGDQNLTGTLYYGSLQAQSPHMMEADESGYSRFCVYDVQGYWDLIYYDGGERIVETSNAQCIQKYEKIEARRVCLRSDMLFNATDDTCYVGPNQDEDSEPATTSTNQFL